MDYTLLEISRILGKSKSTIEYQVKKLTEDQKAAFCFVAHLQTKEEAQPTQPGKRLPWWKRSKEEKE